VAAVVPSISDSALALDALEIGAGDEKRLYEADRDTLLYVVRGEGSVTVNGGESALTSGDAVLLLAGEEADISGPIEGVCATVGDVEHRHAALGRRELVTSVDPGRAAHALESRAYQVLFGPHNGSLRATLFVGYVPPGRAAWHYHLYDEIVFLPDFPARVHREHSADDVGAGSAFRLRPREIHIVENPNSDADLTLIGVFTPAGSPSAAYLKEA
jgi:mannose-6-phosphate isomerase-like protein (cupin superfamily)